jgi:Xaa-Pro aminopeptidase
MLYLSGFNEPDSCLVLKRGPEDFKSILFVRENDPLSLLWSGPRTGSKDAVNHFGVDGAYSIDSLSAHLEGLQKDHRLYHVMDENTFVSANVQEILQNRGQDCSALLHQMRVKKRKAETDLMKIATKLAAEAYLEVLLE